MSESSKPLVLVTGATGFVASHIIGQLLDAGYSVRGTARSAKVKTLGDATASLYPRFEVVEVGDIVTSDLSDVLKGVGAIIHAASPLAGRQNAAETLQSTIAGTLHVLRQAVAAGVNKVVLLSSWGTTCDPDLSQVFAGRRITQSDWGHATKEDTLDPSRNPLYIYIAAKILAERAAWDFARSNPKLDLATINPPFIYGPYPSEFPSPGKTGFGTNSLLYALIAGAPGGPLPMQLPPHFCDVRDVARAHVAALDVPAARSDVEKKRYLLCAGDFSWSDAVKYLSDQRPTLQDRLPSTDVSQLPGKLSTVDVTAAKEDLNISEYITWEKTVLDTIDAILALEKSW